MGSPHTQPHEILEQIGFGTYQYRLLAMCGLGMAADGMEMFVSSIILPELPASWHMDAFWRGICGGAVFVGMAIGASIWGPISDSWGRLNVVRATLLVSLVFGIVSGLSSSFVMLMLLRGAFGVGIGGFTPVGTTLLAESGPAGDFSFSVALVLNLFSVGAIFESALAAAVLPSLGWSWLLVLSAVPLAVPFVMSISPLLVESPHWLTHNGKTEKAHEALLKMAAINGYEGAPLPKPQDPTAVAAAAAAAAKMEAAGGRGAGKGGGGTFGPPAPTASAPAGAGAAGGVVGCSPRSKAGKRLWRLLFGSHLRVTAWLFALWFLVSFTYYGIVFILPTWLEKTVPPQLEYMGVLLSAVAELPGNWAAGFLADRLGRVPSLWLSFGASCVLAVVCALVAKLMDNWVLLLVIVCLLKATICSAFALMYIYTPEAYPTPLRGAGFGFCTVFTRLAGAVTPLVAAIMLDSSGEFATFMVYAGALALGAIVAATLPFETRGRDADAIDAAANAKADRPRESTPLIAPPPAAAGAK